MSTCKYLYCEVQLTYVHGSYLVTCQCYIIIYQGIMGNHKEIIINHKGIMGNYKGIIEVDHGIIGIYIEIIS